MSTVGDIVDILRQRVRGHATDTAGWTVLVQYAQKMVGLGTRQLLTSVALQTYATQAIYNITGMVPNQGLVVAVRDDGRDLVPLMDWEHIGGADRHWLRTFAEHHEVWAMVGRDVLCLYPAKPVHGTVELVYVQVAPDIASYPQDAMVLPEDYDTMILDMAEALGLLRERRVGPLDELLKRIAATLPKSQHTTAQGV